MHFGCRLRIVKREVVLERSLADTNFTKSNRPKVHVPAFKLSRSACEIKRDFYAVLILCLIARLKNDDGAFPALARPRKRQTAYIIFADLYHSPLRHPLAKQ